MHILYVLKGKRAISKGAKEERLQMLAEYKRYGVDKKGRERRASQNKRSIKSRPEYQTKCGKNTSTQRKTGIWVMGKGAQIYRNYS